MREDVLFKGCVIGMENSGATFIKTDGIFVFFQIEKGSLIDNKEALQKAKLIFRKLFGLGLKIKYVHH